MREMFGTKFYSIYGKTPSETWEATLSRMTDEQCARGMEALLRVPGDFPPTLPQFVQLCDPGKSLSLAEAEREAMRRNMIRRQDENNDQFKQRVLEHML